MECPNCKCEFEFKNKIPEWNVQTICPNCKTKLLIEFDFIFDNEEELYLYEPKIIKNFDNIPFIKIECIGK